MIDFKRKHTVNVYFSKVCRLDQVSHVRFRYSIKFIL